MSDTPIASGSNLTRFHGFATLGRAHVAALFSCFVALAGTEAQAQLAVTEKPGTVYNAFHGEGQSQGAETITVYTVPSSRKAVLTDIIVSAREATGLCYFQISGSKTGTKTYEIVVNPSSTLHISLNTGYTFSSGEEIRMSRSNRIAAQCSDYLFFSVSGYLFRGPETP